MLFKKRKEGQFLPYVLSRASHPPARPPARPPCPCLCPPRNRFVANQAHMGALRVDDESSAIPR